MKKILNIFKLNKKQEEFHVSHFLHVLKLIGFDAEKQPVWALADFSTEGYLFVVNANEFIALRAQGLDLETELNVDVKAYDTSLAFDGKLVY